MKKFSVIMTIDKKNWIWNKSWFAWVIKADNDRLEEITSKTKDLGKLNAVVMWRRIWESIPAKNKPLSDRINCIVSKKLLMENNGSKIDDFVLHFNSFEHALEEIENKENVEDIYVIGWSSVFEKALEHKNLDKIYLTEIDHNFKCERSVEFDKSNYELLEKWEWQEENGIKFRFSLLQNKKS